MNVSDNYRKLKPEEVDVYADVFGENWRDPDLPRRQYEMVVRDELKSWKEGSPVRPYDRLIWILNSLPASMNHENTRLLEVGAASAYYSDVLKTKGFKYSYTGLDYSEAFEAFAKELYPDVKYQVGDARDLPFEDDSFDIVISGGCLLHIREYPIVIRETLRVARRFAIFHRTPIVWNEPTTFYLKDAYGVPCLEIHFNSHELHGLFTSTGWKVVAISGEPITGEPMAHRSYLLEKS